MIEEEKTMEFTKSNKSHTLEVECRMPHAWFDEIRF